MEVRWASVLVFFQGFLNRGGDLLSQPDRDGVSDHLIVRQDCHNSD